MPRLLIFDTHPIQYRSPVFAALARKCSLKVVFFNPSFDGRRWWFHEVGKIPEQNWNLALDQGFSSFILGTRQLGWVESARLISRFLDTEKPDSVGIYGYYLPEHWILRWLCARKKIPLIFVGETFQKSRGLRAWLKRPLLAYFFAGVTKFITIGNKTWNYYLGLGIDQARLVAGKYCVDFSFFKRSTQDAQADRQQWRERFGIAPEAFVVLFVGRLFERKRPEDALALQKQLGHLPDLHLVLVGNGPQEKELQAQGSSLPRTLFTGFQNQAETRQAYYGADVLFVPSEYETWGLVVNEAASCGRPSVLTDTCGVAEDLIVHGETGFVFPKGQVLEACHWIETLYRDRALSVRMGLEAQRRVATDYSVECFSDAFLQAAGTVI